MKHKNFYNSFTWKKMMNAHKVIPFNKDEYFNILCPKSEYPEFIDKYIELPILQRLKKIGLLCGTDWTKLYNNRFFYSRLEHSIGVALITWHFTKNKAQTLAALLHDVSTPVFSHVSDFRKGDALTQTSTEEQNSLMLLQNNELISLLQSDKINIEEIKDYHIYPIADNQIPCLSADRLEYMFPSGAVLDGSWTLQEIKECYNDIIILKNEDNIEELGFKTMSIALNYCKHFCLIGHILQLNENKLTLNLLGTIMNLCIKENVLKEEDFMTLGEEEIINILENKLPTKLTNDSKLYSLYKTFRNMKKIKHTNKAIKNYYCVNLNVKQRYINPLVLNDNQTFRIYDCNKEAKRLIDDFLAYNDTPFGCVKLLH